MRNELGRPPEFDVRADCLAESARDASVLQADDSHARRALAREKPSVKWLEVSRVHRHATRPCRDRARLPVPVAGAPDRELRIGRRQRLRREVRTRAARIPNDRRALAPKRLFEEQSKVLGVLWLADREIREAPEHRDVVGAHPYFLGRLVPIRQYQTI